MRKAIFLIAASLAVFWSGCGDGGTRQKISFINFDNSGNTQVYTMSADGKTQTKLNLTIPADAFFVVASPDASKIAYCITDMDTDQTSIYTMDLKGTEKKLTSGANFGDCIPAFSADGKLIVFESYRDGVDYVQMYVMNADGTNQKRILVDNADQFFPQLSPDKKMVTFFRENSGIATMAKPRVSFRQQWEQMRARKSSGSFAKFAMRPMASISTGDGIYTVNLDGTNPKLVLLPAGYATSAVFSADGKKIYYTTDEFDGDLEIASVNLDGTGLKNLTNSGSTNDYSPVVFGKVILFNRDNTDGYSDIYQMDPDGSNQKNLSNTATQDEFLQGYFSIL